MLTLKRLKLFFLPCLYFHTVVFGHVNIVITEMNSPLNYLWPGFVSTDLFKTALLLKAADTIRTHFKYL